MPKSHKDKRVEARQLFLSGDVTTNAEIASRLKVKPHTVGGWRKVEGWDEMRRKIDKRAAELFVEKIANDRVTLNVKHYKYWDVLFARMADEMKNPSSPAAVRDLERMAAVLDRAQKGQRLAKGMSVAETEEQIRAESQAEIRKLIDAFIDAVKDNVPDEEARDRIRRAVMEAVPDEAESDEEEAWR